MKPVPVDKLHTLTSNRSKMYGMTFDFVAMSNVIPYIFDRFDFSEYNLSMGAGKNYRRMFDEHLYPAPLPTVTARYIRSPYRNIYQGMRRKGDKRVYNNHFDYAENAQGQQVFCRGDFGCLLNHVSVETEGGIPTLLRGGVGYRHFTVLVRATAGVRLKGRVRAYCYNYTEVDDELI